LEAGFDTPALAAPGLAEGLAEGLAALGASAITSITIITPRSEGHRRKPP